MGVSEPDSKGVARSTPGVRWRSVNRGMPWHRHSHGHEIALPRERRVIIAIQYQEDN